MGLTHNVAPGLHHNHWPSKAVCEVVDEGFVGRKLCLYVSCSDEIRPEAVPPPTHLAELVSCFMHVIAAVAEVPLLCALVRLKRQGKPKKLLAQLSKSL